MDSSDEEEVETLPEIVSNYYFEDDSEDPISFSGLPVMWSEQDGVKLDGVSGGSVFLHGTVDKGLKTIYKEVQAWKIDLNNVSPEIFVLSKDKNWFKLQKPRKSYEEMIRTVLITVYFLHYLKRNPQSSAKSLWDNMAKVFRLFDSRPAAKDLENHTSLIKEAIERDAGLANCQFLTAFLEEKPWMRKKSGEGVESAAKPAFIVEDDVVELLEDDPNDDDEEEDVFDSVCAICDNGGDLLCCEGRCMRSFHATTEAGEDSICESLGFIDPEVEAIQQFLCKNCEYKQHQCIVCGELGSSDKSCSAEVFACVSATCGRFYHPQCVAKLLHPKDEGASKELQNNIAGGRSFTCPIHKCCVCGKGENKKMLELQFAVCRRCPRSYHRKCLPKEIAFEGSEFEGETRAWEGLLPNRILIYCLKHKLDEDLGTPVRDHIKFPHVEEIKTTNSGKRKIPALKLARSTEKRMLDNNSSVSAEYMSRISKRTPDQRDRLSSLANRSGKNKAKVFSGQETSVKAKEANVSVKPQKDKRNLSSSAGRKSSATKEKDGTPTLGEKLYSLYMEGSDTEQKEDETSTSKTQSKIFESFLPSLDADSERRIQGIIKEATSSVSMKDVLRKQKAPSTHTQSLKFSVDKTITMGKLEGAVEAVRTALQKLDEGGSIEDAQAVCDPDVLSQLFKWKDKLRVYLSPFIFGPRYTSFGRHFTKVDKLQEIVDKLHWYVQKGDMIVDFCCGTNDFSCLVAKKLEETGKKCSYKNYDLFPAKNMFNFEARDWMTVSPKELPIGDKLIMGLNPPFGVNAALANKFIDKALEFKPKLIILIVPPETQRLDKKRYAYDLVWEDDQFLSGKSFYLPGTVDDGEKQVDQWNLNPPLLYLWSRRDWTPKHKSIARRQGHLQDTSKATEGPDNSGTDQNGHGDVPSVLRKSSEPKELEEWKAAGDGQKGGSSHTNAWKGGPENRQNNPPRNSKKRQHDNIPRDMSRSSPREANAGPFSPHSTKSDMSLDSDVGCSNSQPPVENHQPSIEKYPAPVKNECEMDYAFTLGLDNLIGDIGRSYGVNNDNYLATEGFSNSLSPHPEYRARNFEDPHMGHLSEQPGGFESSSITEADVRYWRDLDIRTQVRVFGHQGSDLSQRTSYPVNPDLPYALPHPPPSTYGLAGRPMVEPSHQVNTSVMQRYAPRLDEMNNSRMGGGLGPDPLGMIRPGFLDVRAPQPGYQGHPPDQGFAPGPYNPYSHTKSSGWLNE